MARAQLGGRFTTARITKRVDVTGDLWRIWLRPGEAFSFRPGQYCTIGTAGIERPYSIVSSPLEPEIELFIERVRSPHGRLTPLLHELEVGAEVTLRHRAKGTFALRPGFRHQVMVATVTGIAPYVSMLRTHFLGRGGDLRFHVLHGASYSDELGYDGELRELAATHPSVHYLPSVSRPDEARNRDWRGATGRINALLQDYLAKSGAAVRETVIYACGHPQMIEDVRARAEAGGYRFEQERFWKQAEDRRNRGPAPRKIYETS